MPKVFFCNILLKIYFLLYDHLNQSFLYFLHEENIFDEKSFSELYNYINKLDSVSLAELKDLYFIQNQIMRHLVYHFDEDDFSNISNLPATYWKYIDLLDNAIQKLPVI